MSEIACAVRSRVWRDGEVVDTDLPVDALPTLVRDETCLVWVDLDAPSPDDLDTLAGQLGLGAQAVEDALAPFERPKVTRHADHLFFITYATAMTGDRVSSEEHGRLAMSRVAGFVLPHALVTVRRGDGFSMDEVVRRWSETPDLLRGGAGALVYGLLDTVVDGQFDTIQELDDEIEALEDELFEEHRPGHQFLRRVYGVRKDLVHLRRVVLPMREVVNAILRHRPEEDTELSRWYDDLYDHVLRAAEWTESLRDMVITVFETNLSQQDTRLNVVMKKLAAWAAIIAVPTAVTGWFGQNLPYPGFANASGLWASVALILGLSVMLYIAFRKQDWL